METRPLGDTGHDSSIMTFGTYPLAYLEQEGANQMVEFVLDYGVNHFDVAPSYGDAELKLGPKLRQYRDEIFLGCKTREREYGGAWRKLERSLDRLGVDSIDLYQVHGLNSHAELETITGDGGALEAFREAREEGLVDHIGLTSHGSSALIRDAIDRISDLATVMFPLNPVVVGKDGDEFDYKAVLARAEEENLGTLGIKAFSGGPWPDTDDVAVADRPHANWYEPVSTPGTIRERFDFAASHGLTTVVNTGDPKLVALVLDAAARFEELDEAAQRSMVERARDAESALPR